MFGRIVGSVMVDPGKFDLGLNLKQNHRYQLPEYSRCGGEDKTSDKSGNTVIIYADLAPLTKSYGIYRVG